MSSWYPEIIEANQRLRQACAKVGSRFVHYATLAAAAPTMPTEPAQPGDRTGSGSGKSAGKKNLIP